MYPWLTAIAGLAYVALMIAGIVASHRDRLTASLRFDIASVGVASAVLVNELLDPGWQAAVWVFNLTAALGCVWLARWRIRIAAEEARAIREFIGRLDRFGA